MNEPENAPIVWGATIRSVFRTILDVITHSIRYARHSIKYFRPVRRYQGAMYFTVMKDEDSSHE